MNKQDPSREGMAEGLLDEAEQLIWAMLDESITESDVKRLEGMMEAHQAVRSRYLDCVQLHTDLTDHFQEGDGLEPPKPQCSPVLGSLDMNLPLGTDSRPWPPVAE